MGDKETPLQVSLFSSGDSPGRRIQATISFVVGSGKTGSILQALHEVSQHKLPGEAEFLLCMLSRERREDISADLNDWYPEWCVKFGTRKAKFLCWWRISCCVAGALLEVAAKAAELVAKVAGLR
jgi:hypothetical protein